MDDYHTIECIGADSGEQIISIKLSEDIEIELPSEFVELDDSTVIERLKDVQNEIALAANWDGSGSGFRVGDTEGTESKSDWFERLYLDCLFYNCNEFKRAFPVHEAGLLKSLKKQKKKLDSIRDDLRNLPDPYVRRTWYSDIDLSQLCGLPEQFRYYRKFGQVPFISIHDSLDYAAAQLSLQIATFVREQKSERAIAPKRGFGSDLIDAFCKACSGNSISANMNSDFVNFSTLAIYVATGEEGGFFEQPFKSAIEEYNRHLATAISTNSNDPELIQQYYDDQCRVQIEDIDYVSQNGLVANLGESLVLQAFLVASLSGIAKPTSEEAARLAGLTKE